MDTFLEDPQWFQIISQVQRFKYLSQQKMFHTRFEETRELNFTFFLTLFLLILRFSR
jgi:hypothetical protein